MPKDFSHGLLAVPLGGPVQPARAVRLGHVHVESERQQTMDGPGISVLHVIDQAGVTTFMPAILQCQNRLWLQSTKGPVPHAWKSDASAGG
jgi:hypothetical protein